MLVDGVFGYSTYDAVQYFEDIIFQSPLPEKEEIPEVRYNFFKYVLAINHLTNELLLFEHIVNGGESEIDDVTALLHNRNIATYRFDVSGEELSNLTDEEYRHMVTRGKEHCFRGDVFQIVLSRQFRQSFTGDEFNVYRALRSINPPRCGIKIDNSLESFAERTAVLPKSHLCHRKSQSVIDC